MQNYRRWDLRRIQMEKEKKNNINERKCTFFILLETTQMATNIHSQEKK